MERDQGLDGSVARSGSSAEGGLIPPIALPKGGGAIQGIGETFGTNPMTGTASISVPIAMSPSRLSPALSLTYDSGSGNGSFGLGWTLSVFAIARKTDKRLPLYQDADESDVFVLSGAEDLVPLLVPEGVGWARAPAQSATYAGVVHSVHRYRPRVETAFARVEHWINSADDTSFWKVVSRDNVTSLYGIDGQARIADPADPARIFRWLLQRTWDDKGNVVAYEYKGEDRLNVEPSLHETNRGSDTQRYLKFVRYGNTTPYYPNALDLAATNVPQRWFFHVAFDYGEHSADQPRLDDNLSWPARLDSFSTFRAGFEVRTRRLCRRVLMFHDFPELGSTPVLVKSTDFTHDAAPGVSLLRAIAHTSHRGEQRRSLPPIAFGYSAADIDETVHAVSDDALENLPYGVDSSQFQWVDLDSEGSPGILSEQGAGWFYKRNVSNVPREAGGVRAAFEPVELVAARPSAPLAGARWQLVDLSGGGEQSLAQFDRPMAGFHARNEDFAWEPFTAFESAPNIAFADPNLRMLDLDGDGTADVLISGDDVLTWHASLGERGFGSGEQVRKAWDENEGPALVFADGTHCIFLADMSGDGLTDLVRIRSGEICYWPNLGFGRFGRKVSMSDAPSFDSLEAFNPARVRLIDIDGSSTVDIVYLGRRAVSIHANLAGNSWAPARVLREFTAPDELATVTAVDLLGNGTACLVCSSALPGDAGRQMRYVDLMGGVKPHLLVSLKNNLGSDTRVSYVASTRFYLQDRLAGTPWLTRLAFPVHVVERVEIVDAVSRARVAKRFAYHHGYFDGMEREFRGFGMVEEWDSESFEALGANPALNLDPAHALPPVLTRTWFHTGAHLPGARVSLSFTRVSLLFKDEYWREPGLDQAELDALLLPDTVLPVAVTLADGGERAMILSAEEEREACRALKGSVLRQEVYALDDSPRAGHPYSVSERNYTVQMFQPRGGQRHAVFHAHPRETIDYAYERTLYDVNGEQRCDPRVGHSMVLAVDAFGNVLQTASIAYGRRHPGTNAQLTAADIAIQQRGAVTIVECAHTNAIDTLQAWRAPLPAESSTFELLNIPQIAPAGATALLRFDDLRQWVGEASDGAHDVPYEDIDASSAVAPGPHRRLIEQLRTLYRADDLGGALPLGTAESLALPFEDYKLALTPGLLGLFAAKISAADATALLKGATGGYRDLDHDGRLWVPSGQLLLSTREHFYLPAGARDTFGNLLQVAYDAHELFMASSVDALGNTTQAQFDYRVLKPTLVTDANGNRSAAAYDLLGLLVATAVMGKQIEPDGIAKGDTLAGVVTDLSTTQIDAFLADPRGQAASLLGDATTRFVYDVEQFLESGAPGVTATLMRETHVSELAANMASTLQVSLAYSDGFGRIIQSKLPAAPGPLTAGGATVEPRWVGSGWTIYNNKGAPVRQYEPFFSATHGFEFAVQVGVSATLFYDPLGRAVATLHPDHSYEKNVFDPWWQQAWDANDTVLLRPMDDQDVSGWIARLEPIEYTPTWHALRADPAFASLAAARWSDANQRAAETDAAAKASEHAGTPAAAHLDPLGRAFLSVADNGAAGTFSTRTLLDIEGNERAVIDALDRTVMRYEYDMLGAPLHSASMDAGERWALNDVAGKPLCVWNARGQALRFEYDALQRPGRSFVRSADAQDPTAEILFSKTDYGEGQPDDVTLNLRTRIYRQFDTAGIVVNDEYDFKGNPLAVSRRLASVYRKAPDWSGAPALEIGTFESSSTFNALNRRQEITAPDGSIFQPVYDESNKLRSLAVRLRGASTPTDFVSAIDYDASGRRQRIVYGNGVTTLYTIDPLTMHMVKLESVRASDQTAVQRLEYTFDPVGNLTRIRDGARQQPVFFNNQAVTPDNDYRYDALYRLIRAEGREHIGQLSQPFTNWNDEFRVGLPQPGDGQAMRRYAEQYDYDPVGNLIELAHQAASGNWARSHFYEETSALEATRHNNRLTRSQIGGNTVDAHQYDAHGNMTTASHLTRMDWNFLDQLSATSRQVVANGGAETTWYVYDGSGARTRKITERQNGVRKDERIYLGCFEAFLVYDGSGAVDTKRETLHVMDDAQRIAIVETKAPDGTGAAEPLVRYQFGNHLGSTSLELDEDARVVTYEEYFPYGGTSYQAVRGGLDANPKRYRFTAMERDDETGFSYHAARYYAPWLCRWVSPDPASIAFGVMVYGYASENPLTFSDPTGLEPDKKFVPPKRPPLKKVPTKTAPNKEKAPVKKAPAKNEPAKKEPVKKEGEKKQEPQKEKAPAGTTPARATPAKMTEAQKTFRADHSKFKPEQLDNIDRALAKISADNPGLSEAFYTFYTGRNFTDDLDPATGKFGDTGMPLGRQFYTKILKAVVDLKPPPGSTDDAEALLGGTLIHELSHGPYALYIGALGGATEGKAYGIESFFSGHLKDKAREAQVMKLGPKWGDREAYDSSEYLMTQLYAVIGGTSKNPLLKDVTVKQAQDLVVEFITKNGDQMSAGTRTLFTAILKDGSSTYSKRSWGSLP